MIFTVNINGKTKQFSLLLNSKTVSKNCRGSNSNDCAVDLITMKPLTNLLYKITMYIGEENASVTVTKKKFPYLFSKLDYKTESTCYNPKFENDEWEFIQELRKDLTNRSCVIFKDDNTGITYMAKCMKTN